MESHNISGGRFLRIAFGIMTLAILLLAGGVSAATLTVNASGGADYTRIHDAIANASSRDTILVYSGIYYENVNVTKQLTLRGIGNPVVDAGESGNAITLSANGITLEGFTATGSGSYPEAGIKVTSSNNTLSGNNAFYNANGIFLYSSSNNTLSGNNAFYNANGIFLYSSSNNTLSENNASNNDFNGIWLSSSSNNTLSGNNAFYNSNGISLDSSSNNMLSGNNASNNKGSCISLYDSSNNTLSGNNASNNDFNGIFLYDSSNNTLSGNNASNNDFNGISLSSSSNNTLSGNNASNNGGSGIYLYYSSNNKIYNNIFNNTNNFYFYDSNINTWNTTRQSGTNIIGGPYLGGNFWAYPNGKGFSQICPDVNGDGICDSPNTLDSENIDYLPLAIVPQLHDILSYYRGLGNNPTKVETTDLLKAADDWSNNRIVDGFASPITTQQLLTLADKWSRS